MSQDTLQHDKSWKEKYFDQLEQTEDQEKQWQETENALRRGLSRLTLAFQGLSPELDASLDELRETIQKEKNNEKIFAAINKINEIVENLTNSTPTSGANASSHPSAEKAGSKKGLLGRLFGASKADIEVPGTTEPVATHEETIETNQPGIDDVIKQHPISKEERELLSQVLLIFLNNLTVNTQDSYAVKSLRTRLNTATDAADYNQLATEFAELIEAQISTKSSADAGAENDVIDISNIKGIFSKFLENISIPAELKEQADELQARFTDDSLQEDFSSAFKAVVEFVTNMRGILVREKEELESFLLQLTNRLQDLEKDLAGAIAHKEASRESGRRLEVDVSAKVVDIKATVHNASDLQDLKSTIAGRLDGINSYIQEYRHQEDQHLYELENELIQVNGKLRLAEQETSQLRQRLKEQYKKALIDPLTEINNRVAYDEHISKEYARWKRYDIPLTLLIIDVDHFKNINDTYGHKAGDMALKYIAQVLNSNLRTTDFICRYGGEEFAVFISDIPHDKILDVAEKLRIAIEGCNFHYQGTRVPITISCGIAFYNGDDTPETVFKRADDALYKAKENGRNKCCISDTL